MLGKNLKALREERGLSQEAIGEIIGRTGSLISLVEAGRASLSPEQISTLADSLGVNEEWLRCGTGPMTATEKTRDRRTIGERIYEIRRNRHQSQTEFAVLLGVSRNTISLLERRKISASQALIRAVVEKTGVSEVWLRTGEAETRAEEIMEWLEHCPADKERIREWLENGA